MTEKTISVIIPAYNVEKYIRRCMDSLVNQTYEKLEVIVVNDSSTDRTGDIIAEYAERFPEKVFQYNQKKNAGQAAARNFGLTKATGDYIGFVDSDDFVSTDMYELLYREAEQTGCDLVTCGYYGCDVATGMIKGYQMGYKGEFNQSIYENPKILRVNSPYPWNKLYSRELLDRAGFQFPEGMIFEDLCAVLPLFLDAKKVGRVHAKLYYYMKGRKGGTLSTYDERHGQIIDVLQIVNDVYRHRGEFEHFYDTLLFFNIRHIFARFDEMEHYRNHSFRKEFSERAFALLDAYFPGWQESEAYEELRGRDENDGDSIQADAADGKKSKKAVEKPGKGGPGKSKTGAKKPGAEEKKRSELFEELLAQRKVEKGTVLIKCFHGNDIRGACYYIGKMLAADKEGGYKVYVAAMDAERVEKFRSMYGGEWNIVDMGSDRYVELLATAEYIVTNRGVVEFYRKRKGQKYIFTDFMPSIAGQGREVTYGAKQIQGMQFGLALADAILFPQELKDEFIPLLERYSMDEICRDKGVFVSVSEFFGWWHASQPGRGREESCIAYMPSLKVFPGLEDTRHYLYLNDLKQRLTELDGKLEDGRNILVIFPKAVGGRFRENKWKHIKILQKEEETDISDILASCQGLVGDYGPELYMMKALGKPVCRFVTDEPDVAWSQGISREAGAQFERFDRADQVAEWVNGIAVGEKTEAAEGDGPGLYPASYREVFHQGKGKKNRRHRRTVVYVPDCKNRKEFDTFIHRHDRTSTLFLIEKRNMDNHMAAWLKRWEPHIRYVVIVRSFVITREESRLVKYRLTTKEKLKEKRDKERYGV